MRSMESLGAKLTTTFGLTERPGFWEDLRSAALRTAERNGLSVDELAERLDADPRLLHELVGPLTVGETFFLRHPQHFELAVDHVRRRLRTLADGELVHVWSAGCASGEEPYSVAIAVDFTLGEAALRRLAVRATDANPAAVDKARSGVYGAWSFRGVPCWLVARYFRPDGGGFRLARDAVREAVSFEVGGIAQAAARMPTASLDVVLFRNVAIYLQPESLVALYRELRRVLRPDGLLLVGHSDPRPGPGVFVRCSKTEHTSFRPAPDGVPNAERPTVRPPGVAVRRRRRRPTGTLSRSSRSSRAEPRRESRPPEPVAAPKADPDPGGLRALADGGRTELALGALAAQIRRDPGSACLHALRGRVLLDAGSGTEAVEALRRAVFLAPEDVVARFWYAQALGVAGEAAAALRQLDEVERRLERAPATVLLDGTTSPEELLEAVRLFQEGLR